MVGFGIGTLCLLALAGMYVKRRRAAFAGGWGGCGGGWGGYGRVGCGPGAGWHGGSWPGAGGHGDGGRGGGWWGRGAPDAGWSRGGPRALRWLFRRLDTTPGQEKVIAEAFDELLRAGAGMREETQRTRDDVARAVTGATFDEPSLDAAFARHRAQLEALQQALASALRKTHEVLDERQRGLVAEFFLRLGAPLGGPGEGGGAGGCGPSGAGPYRA
jgi:Spy/CpxP family protein refolding chaperone